MIYASAKDWFGTKLRRMHWLLVLLTFSLCAVGFAMLYSASGGSMQPWASEQMIRFAIGTAGMFTLAILPLSWLLGLALPLYLLGIILLVFVELFGTVGMGAQRWINLGFMVLQPSEPMKLAVILLLARYFHQINFERIGQPVMLILPLLYLAIPAALILKQPNLGTATIVVAIGIMMFFATGVRWWKFIATGAIGLAALPVVWLFMHDYQKRRVLTFLNPEADPLGAGYNIMQSKIAIGGGGLYGQGYLQGPQNQLNFLPEKHTDFIFTMLAEEFGFSGSMLLLAGFALLLLLCYHVALTSGHHFGRMIATGVAAYFFLHIFINMAMVMGMIPVVGVPLPFLSYGGTMLMTSLAAVGLLLNVHINQDVTLPRRASY